MNYWHFRKELQGITYFHKGICTQMCVSCWIDGKIYGWWWFDHKGCYIGLMGTTRDFYKDWVKVEKEAVWKALQHLDKRF